MTLENSGENSMSAVDTLEQLQKKRTELEDKWASLQQKEKTLEENIKALEEKLTVQLEGKISEKNELLGMLESSKRNLEEKLKELQGKPESYSIPEVPKPKEEESFPRLSTDSTLEEPKIEEERLKQPVRVTVESAVSGGQPAQHEWQKEREDKKKRKW